MYLTPKFVWRKILSHTFSLCFVEITERGKTKLIVPFFPTFKNSGANNINPLPIEHSADIRTVPQSASSTPYRNKHSATTSARTYSAPHTRLIY